MATALVGCRNGAPAPASAGCSARPSALADAGERIDSLLAATREAEEIPGLAAGVVCGDSLVLAVGYGVYAVDDARPVTPQTRFRIASITKLFTATAILKLEESGALALSDLVQDHLPWFRIGRPDTTGTVPITIRDLLTHTAGMPRDSRLTDFARLFQPTREAAIEALPDQSLEAAPGERYRYSNLGYAVLGEVIAAASGTSYAEYLGREILRPLGMTRTLVHPAPQTRAAWGHGPRRATGGREKAGFWHLRFATPAGGMASSVRDLAEFVALQLAPYRGKEPALLSSEALRGSHRVQFTIDPERGGSGLAWGVETSDGQHLIYHGGELPEQSSYLVIDLEQLLGVIVLANAQEVAVDSLALESLARVREVF